MSRVSMSALMPELRGLDPGQSKRRLPSLPRVGGGSAAAATAWRGGRFIAPAAAMCPFRPGALPQAQPAPM